METSVIWVTKLVLAHLLSDFVLQPYSWIESRKKNHFRSPHLYLHIGVTALAAFLLLGTFQYWNVILVIAITHLLIDGWKSYQPDKTSYFLIDQALHFMVIGGCWYFSFWNLESIRLAWQHINTPKWWLIGTGFVFLTQPAGIVIGQLTRKWRNQLPDADSLGNAGKWIGIIERVLILIFILHQQYASVGLMITAKSLLRFNEPNRQEVKTEYLLIGTLISFSVAVATGIILLELVKS